MNVREKAWQSLCAICYENTYSNLLLRHELDGFSSKDRSLITQIVYGTLKNYRSCRYAWESYIKKEPDQTIAALIDMSVFQLLFMDRLPAYAVINDAVELAKKVRGGAYKNFVNAVLHKVDQQGMPELPKEKERRLALETSHPDWIVAMWKAQYGWEFTERICESNVKERPATARVNTLRISKEELLAQEPLFQSGIAAKDALYYQKGNLAATSWYREGWITIQDEASQMVADYVDAKENEHVLDVCSAPGTKATHIAQRMNNKGYLLALDLHAHRTALIQEGAKRLGIDIIEARCMDATDLHLLKDKQFDRVLCDVPCSGYGVMARKSDIKYHMKSSDMDTLIPLQYQILCEAAKKVKEKGVLVYATCTLNKKENEKQIEHFLKEHEEFRLEKSATVFPFEYQSDGFFMAKMIRR